MPACISMNSRSQGESQTGHPILVMGLLAMAVWIEVRRQVLQMLRQCLMQSQGRSNVNGKSVGGRSEAQISQVRVCGGGVVKWASEEGAMRDRRWAFL